ncbi:hypothetical protein BH10PSE5_BH10PSE5_13290 [soil metagenome]
MCIRWGEVKWREGRMDVDDNIFPDTFRREVRAAGFESGSDSLFDKDESSGEFTVGARVKSMSAQLCSAESEYVSHREKGSMSLTVEWQIYSRLQRKVVATVATSGAFALDRFQRDPVANPLLVGAFRQNVRSLTDSDEFRKFFMMEADQAAAERKIQSNDPITLAGAAASARPISDASGAVVVVLAGGGHGSGFLVSADGYMITNEHVVGKETKVRIRWSDGFESDGEVIRSHKARDVALVRTNPHGRQPLYLQRGAAVPGATVYAVGAPLDLKFQSTVTKGIVSANRLYEGFSFIQSDVAVTHGNSGGPLLNEKGAVVGITDWGQTEDGAPVSLNFFIPIGDALDFLNLKTAP